MRGAWLTSLLALGGLSPSLYPALDTAKLRFENNGVPTPGVPRLPGPSSPWRIAQWLKPEALDPARFGPASAPVPGPAPGTPVASVATDDGQSAVGVYRAADGLIVRLRARDGQHNAGGSSNLFLTASPLTTAARFDRVITYTLRARLAEATLAASPRQIADATVLAHVFTGFTVHLHGVLGAPDYDLFLQIAHANSRRENAGYFRCTIGKHGRVVTLGWGGTLPNDPVLPFRADHGPLHPLRYVLNDYLHAVLATPPPCGAFAKAALDPARWRLGGIYLGAGDARGGGGGAGCAGCECQTLRPGALPLDPAKGNAFGNHSGTVSKGIAFGGVKGQSPFD